MGPLPARQIVGERTSGPVTVAMLLIVISFSGSLVISQFRLRNIEDRAATIFQEALPNLEHVSTLRTELRRLGMYVTEYALAGDARLSPSRQDLREVRARVGAELEAYRARPGPPEEATAWVEIAAGLSLLDESVDQTLQAADAKVAPALIQPLLEIFHTRLERADAAILRLRQTQVDLVRSDSERILEARQASLRLALALGGGSLLLALLASGLVLQTLKSRAELKEAHDRLLLRHANRWATVGQLAAGIAHELGSPLQVVAGRAKLLSTGESADEDARSAGRIILGQAQRMTSIVRGLLDYARRRPALRAVTDLTEVADQTLQVLRPIARKRSITLELEAEGPLFAQVDTLHIQQALTNLVMNALQHPDWRSLE